VKNILLVEDQHYIISETILHSYGDLDITTVQWGNKAIEAFAAGKFDGVVLDLRLPVLDGFVVLQAIKKIEKRTPVIILSAFGDRPSRERAARLGADAFFVKPPDYRKLYNKLTELMALAHRDRMMRTNPFSEDESEKLAKYRRLWKLKQQAASMGLDTPPHIAIEIEDLEKELDDHES